MINFKYIYKMSRLKSKLNLKYDSLLLRIIGQGARKFISDELERIPEGNSLCLDFENINLTDVSFMDEAILYLQKEIARGKFGNRRTILINMCDNIIENLEAAILLRQEKYNERVLVLHYRKGTIDILGNIEKSLYETFEIIRYNRKLSARQLAKGKELEINTASNRLKRLYDYGLITREEIVDAEGRQHMYYLAL